MSTEGHSEIITPELARARREGIEKGIKLGLKVGKEIAREEGMDIGIDRGLGSGRLEFEQRAVIAMLKANEPKEKIMSYLDLTEDVIAACKRSMG